MIAYKTVKVDGLQIFYREAGRPSAPTIVLLHGFSSSSHMFRNLIPALAADFHQIAPDYPGFGSTDNPSLGDFDYRFDRLADLMEKFLAALGIERFIPYMMDYGAPVGFRIVERDLKDVEIHLLNTGHFALEEEVDLIAELIQRFWDRRFPKAA